MLGFSAFLVVSQALDRHAAAAHTKQYRDDVQPVSGSLSADASTERDRVKSHFRLKAEATGPGQWEMADDINRRTFGQRLGIAAVAGALHALPDLAGAQGSGVSKAQLSREELCDLSAIELAASIRRKDVSARDVMSAHLARIERVNPRVNAIVTLVADRAMAEAARADDLAAKGGTPGPLHGLPVAHKDLVDTAGIRTTRGSRFYRDSVPTRDALIVTRMRAAGAITIGKTNTPELGAGSQTFNDVFGATRNPYDLTKTCGGSSGGVRDGADRRRHRRRRLAPQSRGLLQRRRTAPVAGSGAGRNQQLVATVCHRSDGSVGRGCGVVSQRACRTGPA